MSKNDDRPPPFDWSDMPATKGCAQCAKNPSGNKRCVLCRFRGIQSVPQPNVSDDWCAIDSSVRDSEWTCSFCTCINFTRQFLCEACGKERKLRLFTFTTASSSSVVSTSDAAISGFDVDGDVLSPWIDPPQLPEHKGGSSEGKTSSAPFESKSRSGSGHDNKHGEDSKIGFGCMRGSAFAISATPSAWTCYGCTSENASDASNCRICEGCFKICHACKSANLRYNNRCSDCGVKFQGDGGNMASVDASAGVNLSEMMAFGAPSAPAAPSTKKLAPSMPFCRTPGCVLWKLCLQCSNALDELIPSAKLSQLESNAFAKSRLFASEGEYDEALREMGNIPLLDDEMFEFRNQLRAHASSSKKQIFNKEEDEQLRMAIEASRRMACMPVANTNDMDIDTSIVGLNPWYEKLAATCETAGLAPRDHPFFRPGHFHPSPTLARAPLPAENGKEPEPLQKPEDVGWACMACTFRNAPPRQICEMCQGNRFGFPAGVA
jgi:hypothetical protein